ncbi:MAG: ATP-binding cassette domain-containing protein, partial [Planctomycetota bacterium]
MDSLSARHASDETAGSPSPQTPSPERGTQIQCENVCVRFDETPVLQNVGLSVPKSEIIAILGPSGCGKTTLLRAIAGLQSIDSGDITMNPPVQPQRGHVGF